MADRLINSVCRPQLQPSVCLGVLSMVTCDLSCCSMGIGMFVFEFYWRRVEWMCLVEGGGGCVRDRSGGMCGCP
jgi:hypothetical protein